MNRLALVAAACLIVACGDGGGGVAPPVIEFRAYSFSFADSVGDPPRGRPMATRNDVLSLAGTVDSTNLTITITFTAPVSFWTDQGSSALDGFLDLDLDENSATGIRGAAEQYGGSAPLGAEFYLSLRDNGSGEIALVSLATGSFMLVPATIDGTRMHITIPRELLDDPDGRFRMSLVVGDAASPATDFVPNSGYLSVAPK
jgi:hypothetical protein